VRAPQPPRTLWLARATGFPLPRRRGWALPMRRKAAKELINNAKNLRLYGRCHEEILKVVWRRIVEKEQLEKLLRGANAEAQGEKTAA